MIKLNDYLYSGDTVLKILHRYAYDLKHDAEENSNKISLLHSNFLMQFTDLLEHNDFLTQQSQRIREFYIYMAKKYPHLAFTFRGRIKSLIRAEQKFNGYILSSIRNHYIEHGTFPSGDDISDKLTMFRDLIAYRIVISMPRCHMAPGEDKHETELGYLYEIANALPEFMEERGFRVVVSGKANAAVSPKIREDLRPYFRDYVTQPRRSGYQSLHVTFYDMSARCYVEIQLRTKEMDDFAEIGAANHYAYEQTQRDERSRIEEIPEGANADYDEAMERCAALQKLELSTIDVNMFGAVNNHLINDGCGLYRGRLILPYEHLSRFQTDVDHV